MLETTRLRLVLWQESHRASLASMHADALVMADQGGPISRAESDQKFERYVRSWERNGIGRWAIEDSSGGFVGYTGVMHREDASHPLGQHFEIGWRLVSKKWRQGFAIEAATVALADASSRIAGREILSYTAPDNLRSQAVMTRLDFKRAPERDFVVRVKPNVEWKGLVWIANPS